MGEGIERRRKANGALAGPVSLETPGGMVHLHWDERAAATPYGQMPFFIEFLEATGLWEKWVEECPLAYRSPNGSSKRDVLGTWLLSILSGHWRYAHIAGLRTDGVNPQLLGMQGVVSEDTVRRALSSLDEEAGTQWMRASIEHPVLPLLEAPWILDVDVTVKPLYGKQEGAVLGYNPHKPGRPSHAYHSYMMGGMRLVIGMAVEAGNQTHSTYGMPGLARLLESLPEGKRPFAVRGDCSYGADSVMGELEERGQPYLFKLRLTTNVKRYVEKLAMEGGWKDAGQKWEGQDGRLRLQGWRRERRVVLLRRRLETKEAALEESRQLALAFMAEPDMAGERYEYAVLVTGLPLDVLTLAQLYRDRGDAENPFDELKNQWGWGGYTTQDLKRCRFAAMGVALVYNWWSIFVRLVHPEARLEAITSRPLLLSAVARQTSHAGQKLIRVTPMHAEAPKAQGMLTRASQLLSSWKHCAEQLAVPSVLQRLCDYLIRLIAGSPASRRLHLLPCYV